MAERRRARLLTALAVAVAFGLAAAWVKGQGTDGRTGLAPVRAALGNLSAPWVALPFWAGIGRRRWSAAAAGLAATCVALVAFYALTGLVLELDGRTFPADVPLWVRANQRYVEAGLVTGPIMGALGGLWAVRRRPRLLVLAGLLLVAEPLGLLLLGLLHPVTARLATVGAPLLNGWGLDRDTGAARLSVYAAEVVAGLLVLGWARGRRSAS